MILFKKKGDCHYFPGVTEMGDWHLFSLPLEKGDSPLFWAFLLDRFWIRF